MRSVARPVVYDDDFQTAFLDRMRSMHKEDVIDPLGEGKYSQETIDILESEAAIVASQFKA